MMSPLRMLSRAGCYGAQGAGRAWRAGWTAARGAVDARRAASRFPLLADYRRASAGVRGQLAPLYRGYVTGVSTPNAAISLELAVLLGVLCQGARPRRIVDLGSGFSSLVLRAFAAADAVVISVDDDPHWLQATHAFLAAHGRGTQGLMLWDEFAAQRHEPFDLVLHDLGDMARRRQTLAAALALVARPQGLLVLDDAHKPGYARWAAKVLRGQRCRTWSLHRYTADRYGRYSVLAQPGLHESFSRGAST